MSDADETGERNRLDKWLWCARFYKTRSQAAQAIAGGKAHLNGERVKPAHAVRVGDTIGVAIQGVVAEFTVLSHPLRRASRTMLKRLPAPNAAGDFVSSTGSPD